MLQKKCYKNNHEGLRHRGRGSIYATKCAFLLFKKKRKKTIKKKIRRENFCAELAIFDGEREVAVKLTIIVLINSNSN